MDLDEARLRMVPDGGVLFVLDNGIAVQRRRKHEPIPGMDDLGKEDLERATGKRNGSKFLTGTSLRDIVVMTVEALRENSARPGSNRPVAKVFDRPIGIYRGVKVRGLRVLRSNNGRLAHAVPDDENDL